MKKFIKIIAMICIVSISTISLVACKKDDPKTDLISSYVAIDINPSIEMIVDSENKVTSVRAMNEDASVLLYGETGIVGADINLASGKIISLALEYGYLTEENKNISVTVSAQSNITKQEIYDKIATAVTTTAQSINATVQEASNILLSKELEKVKQANAGKTGYDDSLDIAKYRLVKSALLADRKLTQDLAVTLTVDELSDRVQASHEYYKDKLTNAYSQAYELAQRTYNNAKQTYLDSAYVEVYSKKIISNPLSKDSYLAIKYAAYSLAYRTIDDIAFTLNNYMQNPVITSEDVKLLAHNLGIDDTKLDEFEQNISDSEGNITVDSIRSYIENQYRNINEEDRVVIDNALSNIQNILDQINLKAELIPSDEQSNLTIAIDIFETTLSASILIDNNSELMQAIKNISSIKDINSLLDIMEQEIAKTKESMLNNMTDEDKALVDQKMQSRANDLKAAEDIMNREIAKAKEIADAIMQDLKAARQAK